MGEAGSGPDRAAALSDAVFAVALTLLVLDLRVPDLGSLQTEARLQSAVLSTLPSIFSFLLSFGVVALYWISHHRLFEARRRYDHGFVYLNFLFLLTVCFIPFPTGIIGHYGQLRTAAVIYALSLAATGLTLGVLWWYAVVQPARKAERRAARFYMLRALVTAGVFIASIPIILISPPIGETMWSVALVVYLIVGRRQSIS
jgi:uncharacterized membrane protein